LVERLGDPRQLYMLRFNLAVNFTHTGRYAEAAELLARLDRAAGALGVTLAVAVAPTLSAGLRSFTDSFRGEQFRWFPSAAAARASLG
jgi:hypothetical protein